METPLATARIAVLHFFCCLLLAATGVGTAAAQAPSGTLTVTATNGTLETHTDVMWTTPDLDDVLFKITRNGDLLTIVASAGRSYSDATGKPGTSYTYCVLPSRGGVDGDAVCASGSRILFKPTGVSATYGTLDDQVLVTWTDRSQIETGYNLYRENSNDPIPALLSSLPANASLYRDTSVTANAQHRYCIRARDAAGNLSEASCADGLRGTVLAPVQVNATDGQFLGFVRITWRDDNKGASHHTIYREGVEIGTIPADSTRFLDATGALGVVYNYCMTTTKGGTESVQVCDEGRRGGLTPPENVAATRDTYDDRVEVTWRDVANTEDGFEILRDGAVIATAAANTRSYTDRSAVQGIEYAYCVRAVNRADPDNPSRSADVCGANKGRRAEVLAPTALRASDGTLENGVDLTWANESTTAMLISVYRDGTLIKTLPPSQTAYTDKGGIPSGVALNYCVTTSTIVGGAAPAHAQMPQLIAQASVEAAVVEVQRASHEDGMLPLAEQVREARGLRAQIETLAAAQGMSIVESPQMCDGGSRLLKAPTSVAATYDGDERFAEVTWVNTSAVNLGFLVYRQLGSSPPVLADTVKGATRTSYRDYRGAPGTEYTYRVVAYDRYGTSAPGTGTGLRKLKAPTATLASDGTFEDRIVLTWTDESLAETGYRILRDGTAIVDLPANTTRYTDTGVDVGRTHTYRVVAFDEYGGSGGTEVLGSTTLLPPGSLRASTTYPDKVVLVWVDASAHNTGYRVLRDGSILTEALAGDATGYTDVEPLLSGEADYCVESIAGGSSASARACAVGGVSGAVTLLGGGSSIGVTQRIMAEDIVQDAGYGGAVAISGDYAVVGESGVGQLKGRANILFRDPLQGWKQQTVLTGVDDRFGSGVAISGDYAAVADLSATTVTFFERNMGGSNAWGQVAVLGPGPWKQGFGLSMAFEGNTLLVGSQVGSVYEYVRGNNGWIQQSVIAAPELPGPAKFGATVALQGNVAVIGRIRFLGDVDSRTVGYVYAQNGNGWERQAALTTPPGTFDFKFPTTVAIDGDYAFVGEVASGQTNDWGVVQVFKREGTAWPWISTLSASDHGAGTISRDFGANIVISGEQAFISSESDATKGAGAGAVYHFRLVDGTWREIAKLLPDDGSGGTSENDGEVFGASLALGSNELFIGARKGKSTSGKYAGAVYVQPLLPPPSAATASDGQYPDRVQVRWKDESTHEASFRIYRIEEVGQVKLVGTAPKNTEVFDDYSATPGSAYTYLVTAFSSDLAALDANCTLLDASTPQSAPYCLGESSPGRATGWRPTNGALSGRIAALGGGGTEGAEVCLTPGLNRSLHLDGVSGSVETGTLDLSGDAITIEYWFKGTEIQSAVRQQAFVDGGSTVTDYIIAGYGGNMHILSNDGQFSGVPIGSAVTDGQWHHVAMTWQRNTPNGFRSYLDGELVSARASSDEPLPRITSYPVMLGSRFGEGQFASGQLDEVRIWRVVRSQEQIRAAINSSLTGKEPRLAAYWPLNEGAREVTADVTGKSNNGTLLGGAYWSEDGAPMEHCATTDREGNFTFGSLNYGESTSFTVTPTLGDRSFNPAFKKITLTVDSPVQNEVDFSDRTAFTASGVVQYAGTSCPVPDVEIFVAKGREAPILKGTTGSDGAFSISVDPSTSPGDRRTITPRLGSGQDMHSFSPRDTSLVVTGHVADLPFVDRQVRVLNLSFGGSCNTDIGTATVKIFTEDGCYEREVQVNGPYALQLPPQKYLVQVKGVSGAPPALAAEITEFFDNLGAKPVDLTAAADTLALTYRGPIAMEITGFPTAPAQCAATGLTTVDGAGEPLGKVLPNVPIIGEYAKVELTFNVYEEYGQSQTCPVDAGSLTVFDGIGDVKEPVLLEIENGRATYATTGASPDVFDGRVVAGVNRSYQKKLTAVAHVEGVEPVTETRWAIVEGSRERESTFVSAVTGEIPMLILHDPPGSNSYSYLEKGATKCTSIYDFNLTGGGAGPEIDVVIGFKASVGLGIMIESGAGLALRTRTVVGQSIEKVTGGLETCITTNQRYATSADVGWSGEDIFLGVAFNLIFAEADVIESDVASCKIEIGKMLAVDLNENDPYETTFLYGESHIRHSLIPALAGLLEFTGNDDSNEDPQRIRLKSALDDWNRHLTVNENNIEQALDSPEQNRSFSAGADYEYAHTTDTTHFSGQTTRIYVNSENSIGAVVTGGYDQTFLATFEVMHETGRDSSSTSATTRTFGYVLSDGDAGDYFSVDIGTDPVYGTPAFRTRSGRSSIPWEEGTQRRDNPRLKIDPPILYGIAPDKAGRFKLTLINANESNERRQYTLAAPGETNPRNLGLTVAGGPLGGARVETFLLDPGEARTINLDVKAGPSAYAYDSVGVILYSAEEYDIWKGDRRFPLVASDTAWLSVHFKAPCSDIAILRPEQSWALNAATIRDSLQVILHKFDLSGTGDEALSRLGLQYRLQGTSAWLPAAFVQGSSLDGANSWTTGWRPPQEGTYELRAFTECPVGNVYSDVLSGVVDTKAPLAFGTPSPADQVLALGTDISITFDEPVACNSVYTQGNYVNATLTHFDGPNAGTRIPGVEATCDGRTLILAPPETFDWATVEGATLEAHLLTNVLDGQQKPVVLTDLAGNPIPKAISWPFTVRRSAFAWSPVNVEANFTRGTRRSIETKLVNGRVGSADFSLPATFDLVPDGGGAPIPLTPSVTNGIIVSGGSKSVTFVLPDTLALGTYNALLQATRIEGSTVQERIPFYLTAHVVCAPPDVWEVDPARFQYSMTLTAQLLVNGVTSQDSADRVVAMVGNEVRGVGSVAEVAPGAYRLAMVLYSNVRAGEALTFQVWDDGQCTLYEQTSKTLVFEDGAVQGTAALPVVLMAPMVTGPDDILLSAGWTWFSLNRTAADASVNSVLADVATTAGDVVKNQSAFSLYDADFGWVGTLPMLRPGGGYQIQLQQSNLLTQQGTPVDVTTTPVTLQAGWNWIGYLPQQAMPVGSALENFAAEPDDIIKSQTAFAQYVNASTGWAGSLTMMEPGKGYLLKTSSTATAFVYPLATQHSAPTALRQHEASASAAGSEAQATAQQRRPDWSVDVGMYSSNMTVTARVYLDRMPVAATGSLVAVFAGEECRGVASVQAVPGLEQPLAFLVVHGNVPSEGLTTRLYDAASDSVYAGVSTLVFTPDAVLGTIQKPLVLEASATATGMDGIGLPTAFALEQNFPNPFGPSTTIRYALAQPVHVQLLLYDVLGREVLRLVDASQPAGWYEIALSAENLASGVYFYRIEAGSYKQLHQMMLVK